MAYEPIKIELTPDDHKDIDTFCRGWKAHELSEQERNDLLMTFLQYLKGNGWRKEKADG